MERRHGLPVNLQQLKQAREEKDNQKESSYSDPDLEP